MRAEDAARFWSKVAKRGPGECWEWTAGFTNGGYGQFWLQRMGRCIGAHRAAWLATHGAIPRGLHVRHHCDNPPCCNPAHLALGTAADNAADRVARDRTARGDRNGARRYPERLCRGSAHRWAKLSEQDVRTIRAEHARGARLSALAARYGITRQGVFRIVNRLAWRMVA